MKQKPTFNPFCQFKQVIEVGDLVILHLSRTAIQAITVTPGGVVQNKFGHYYHEDMIGMRYGSQMQSRKTTGYILLLHPTPELWTLALPHRTQILYTPDISFVSAKLCVQPGSTVIEAGTGSGSFTHAFMRSLGDSGHLYTFEFHAERCEKARTEFEEHGLFTSRNGQSLMTLTHRDVCKGGFQVALPDGTPIPYTAEAVFLDLPAPWEAVEHLTPHLAQTTRLCCFSPCIEQVQRTVEVLRVSLWQDIECYEVAFREWEARYTRRVDVTDVIDKLKEIKRRREEGVPKAIKARVKIKEGDTAYDWDRIAKPDSEISSHTSFLLFATKRA
ncbi:protein GCD14 [Protomyces lactucae-debilis]|uniref:tRNA (adenine(58)-N(1))-methyltransferase catalytic subunit TRM61 n=1 Tax=Protomyces lactucae-debilis TaxID=2754530 RepID=A0A1Y2F5C4_PROLT|nr:protein GCD14 [Protomyces lactucae-debilis]ORY79053.1 protein GCD14 [Protomyces lactucae-debilis]